MDDIAAMPDSGTDVINNDYYLHKGPMGVNHFFDQASVRRDELFS
jgi:hypothetical protein